MKETFLNSLLQAFKQLSQTIQEVQFHWSIMFLPTIK